MSLDRTPAEISRDRREIARLYLKGETQFSIAEALGISQPTVSRDLKHIQKEWAVASIADIDERKRQELAKIDNLELEYWESWKRSQQNAEIEITRMQGSNTAQSPGRLEKTKRIEGQVGDPRYLQGVQWCITKRCELLGLDAPVKTSVTGTIMPMTWKEFIESSSEADQDESVDSDEESATGSE